MKYYSLLYRKVFWMHFLHKQIPSFQDEVCKHMKKAAKMLRDVDLFTSSIPDEHAGKLFKECCISLAATVKQIVCAVNTEFTDVQTHALESLKDIIQEFKIEESLEKDNFEAATAKAVCQDTRVQKLYCLYSFGKGGFVAACGILRELHAFCTSFTSKSILFQESANLATAVMQDIGKFVEAGPEKKSGLEYVGFIVGTMTLVQSMVRDLATGETRQNLCHRALVGVRKRAFQTHAGVTRKCEAIVSGKPLKWNLGASHIAWKKIRMNDLFIFRAWGKADEHAAIPAQHLRDKKKCMHACSIDITDSTDSIDSVVQKR